MNQAVGDIDQMTQQNAALVEESAAAAQSLREQAARLAQVVSQFRLASDGGAVRSSYANAKPVEPALVSGAPRRALLNA